MKEEASGKVVIGEIICFVMPYAPYSFEEVVLVKNNNEVIPILLEDGQIGYIKDNYPVGKKVAIGFYGGQWHLGISQYGNNGKSQVNESPAYDFPEEDARYIRMVERDFSEDIDDILDGLGLTHLKVAKNDHKRHA